jgi:hypothetical protein
MRLASIAAVLMTACLAIPATAQDAYVILEDTPVVGSTIKRRLVTWPVPINRTYAELSPEHRELVRRAYPDMASGDEPPYPERGMEPLLREVSLVQKAQLGEGVVRIGVKVDEKGEAQSAYSLQSPNRNVTQVVGFALMQQKYKPASCAGQPCARDFIFEHTFTREGRMAPTESYRPYDYAR